MDTHTCQKQVADAGGYRFYPCGAKATVESNGKWFCKRHDPIKAEAKFQARQDKQQKLYRAKWAVEGKQKEILRVVQNLGTVECSVTLDYLKQLGRELTTAETYYQQVQEEQKRG